MTDDSSSEPQKAFIVAAVVLLGLPLIVALGMAGLVLVAGVGPSTGEFWTVSSEKSSVLLLFFVLWGAVSVVAVLLFIVRLLRRSSD
jgi:biotin transporter BioY